MKKRNEILLVLAALIWGIAFVAQSVGGDVVGPYTFNFTRSILGGLALIPAIKFLDKLNLGKAPADKASKKNLLTGGIACGVILCLASNLQQLGINSGTNAGKAGFLTACYIIMVPIFGMFLKRKCGLNVWIGVVLTVIGLYLLCIKGDFSIQLSDCLVMLCAVVFSFHILVIDHFSPLVDGVRMSCIQFLVSGTLSAIPMLIFEVKPFSGGFASWVSSLQSGTAWISILYAGLLSCAIAYTLQIVGQQNVDPTVASLLMSLESVFSVLAELIILRSAMPLRSLVGCGLIFIAVILSQINFQNIKKGRSL